jgi:tetratricopeptide (TPR) repeat protein
MSLRTFAFCRTLLAVALLFVPFAFARAQAPRIAIAGPQIAIAGPLERPVALQSVRVDAEIAGSVALTRIEMVFFNPNRRVLEGELQFPLLDGQAITGFALDIEGKLRDAVPVEKARGQAVFEDITRVRIDPALLQVTQGNNFKLRIYPLLPGKTRTVVLRYSEPLAAAGSQRIYRLPLEYATELTTFALSVRVTGASSAPSMASGTLGEVAFRRRGEDWVAAIERKDFASTGLLELAVPAARGPVVHTQELDGRTYFYMEVPVPAARSPRPAPRVVALAWDSSGSGAERDHAKELALLGAYFRWMKNGEVLLVRVRHAAEPAERFRIADGDWRALRRALEATAYDGATNLGAFVAPAEADEVLLFSDGVSNFGERRLAPNGKPVHAISASSRSAPALLRGVAERSGGRYVDLLAESPRAAADKLIHNWTHVTAIDADGAAQIVRQSAYPAQGRLALAGVLRRREARLRIEVEVPGGGSRTIEVPVRAARPAGLAAGLWARLRLVELEAEHDLNRAEILRLGKAFGVVTSETSLIVLDRVEDYVRHEIVPPSELRADYERLMASAVQRRDMDRRSQLERIVKLFDEKRAWWNKNFPKDAGSAPIAKDELRRNEARAVQGFAAPQSAPSAAREMAAGARADRPNALSIRLKPWTPDAPYARRLREADPKDAYRIYLDEKPGYATSTAFFLDAADLLLEKGQGELAIRVLTNLAEMDLENRHILRILGYRLLQAGRAALAVPVFRAVLDLAPEEPQSWRDLGLALAADRQFQKAVDTLYEVVLRPWHGRFPEIELIALAELNAIAATAGEKLDLSRIDPRLARNLSLDLRVVLTWDADNTDIDLWVTDPNGEKAFYGHRLTYQGGRMSQDFTGGYGPEEFSLKSAKPGRYKIEAQFYGHRQQIVAGATTLQVKLATRFGTPQQQEQLITLRLKGQSEVVFVGEFVVD